MSEGALSRPAFHLGSRGMVIGWHGALGPVVARFESASREEPAFVRGLGHPGADLPVPPAILVRADAVVAFWCEEDGAWSCRVSYVTGEPSDPRLVLEGVERIALAEPGSRARLFGADPRGIVSVLVDADSGAPLGDPIRHVTEERPPPSLDATAIRDEALLVACHPGDREWTVVTQKGAAGTNVRHRHRVPIDGVRARAAGGRAALLFETARGVEVAFVGGGGKVIERPHAAFETGASHLASPDAVFCDDHWVVLAHDPRGDELRMGPLGDKGSPLAVPGCGAPFAAIYRSQSYHALAVRPVGDGAELCLFRCDKRGAKQSKRVTPIAAGNAPALRRRREVRTALGALADRMSSHRGYRDRIAKPELARDGSALSLLDERGRLSLSIRTRRRDRGALPPRRERARRRPRARGGAVVAGAPRRVGALALLRRGAAPRRGAPRVGRRARGRDRRPHRRRRARREHAGPATPPRRAPARRGALALAGARARRAGRRALMRAPVGVRVRRC